MMVKQREKLAPWTKAQINYLRKHYPGGKTEDVANALGFTKNRVKNKASSLGLKKQPGLHTKKMWSAADDAVLRAEYPDGDNAALAEKFQCTPLALVHHAVSLKVKKSPEYMRALFEAGKDNLLVHGAKFRFQKGLVPLNKGKKLTDFMSAEGIASSAKTRFKKGIIPHNTKPIGYERVTVDGYIEVKVRHVENSKDNFELKQRLVYTENFGPIPDDKIVEFIDGDRRNFNPDNLRLSSRRENAQRNIEKHRALPADVKVNIKLVNQLKKLI